LDVTTICLNVCRLYHKMSVTVFIWISLGKYDSYIIYLNHVSLCLRKCYKIQNILERYVSPMAYVYDLLIYMSLFFTAFTRRCSNDGKPECSDGLAGQGS
jgi:hypothetical protein